ncbi:MarR family transcriptional regulator [Micromonospora sp. WMMD980]|uniref:MarR family winged helix-turn-helix transcriptional regulator n=1 Tax=Micromonospora sp. WMMD980 TaxID=3016088 RepID=UPI00241779EF|nr:MarR family transcriptional regulator [Micromonospora sp. WMMD980]MDG4800115.1 MarR family transcriptional regulator [Micromonospora sp. WMMD980]
MAAVPAGDSEHRCGPLLDHLARWIWLRAEPALTPFHLRPRHLVALTMIRAGGGISQQALARTLAMDGTNIVGLLNELESGGLTKRMRSPQDRRRHLVELTPLGVERLRDAEGAMATAEDEVLVALAPVERERLYHLLRRASTAVDEELTAR